MEEYAKDGASILIFRDRHIGSFAPAVWILFSATAFLPFVSPTPLPAAIAAVLSGLGPGISGCRARVCAGEHRAAVDAPGACRHRGDLGLHGHSGAEPAAALGPTSEPRSELGELGCRAVGWLRESRSGESWGAKLCRALGRCPAAAGNCGSCGRRVCRAVGAVGDECAEPWESVGDKCAELWEL